MDVIFTSENLIALVTLFVLEMILGIDNVIFITILADKLPAELRSRAIQMGLALAVISRIVLLFGIGIVIQLKDPLFEVLGKEFTGRDLILLAGGLFLLYKSTREIFDKLEGEDHGHTVSTGTVTLRSILIQVLLLDVVFSLDSVITAIGITEVIPVIVIAIVGAAIVMVVAANRVAAFVERHPSMKVLALSFLMMIGALLVVEGWNHDLAEEIGLKNYIYFAMAFSFLIEIINIRIRAVNNPVKLRKNVPPEVKPIIDA